MFLNSQIYDKLWAQLRTNSNLNHNAIQTAIESLKPQVPSPVENLHHHTLESLSNLNGKAVCLRMMIQDIFQPEYYSAALIKPGKIESKEQLQSKVIINKYWINIDNVEEIDCQDNKHIILDRQVYRAVIPKGQTEWVTAVNGGGNINSVILRCYNKQGFKVGSIVNVVGIVDFQKTQKLQLIDNNQQIKDMAHYYPVGEIPRINVISVLNQKEIEDNKLNYKTFYQKRELDFGRTRQKLLQLFERFCSPKYAQFLLYSLINTQRMSLYLSGQNLEPFLRHLLPYFVKIQVKLPLKQELFPRKSDVLKDSPMQLSQQDTYMIIDFTNMGEGKLEGQQVLNLQFLKKFVEEGQIIYRWEIGQSIFTKNTSGIIARTTTIIEPTFNLKNQHINLQKLPKIEQFSDIVEELREYIIQVRTRSQNVFLSSDSQKNLIQSDFVNQRQETEGKTTAQMFSQRLLICRLQAASLGMSEMTYKIYERVKQLTK